MDKKRLQIAIITFLIIVASTMVGCDKRNRPEKLSPRDVIKLYYDAKNKGDVEFLRQIILFPQGMTVDEINSRIKSEITGADEKMLTRAVGAGIKVEYEKIFDAQTAEVGVVLKMGIPGFKKRIPFQEIVLKKDDNRWKYSYSKYDLSEEQLIDAITKNPYDASAIFHLGRLYQPENPAKAIRYYKKYCELEPRGFWVSKELIDQIKGHEDIENEESKLLEKLKNTPEKSPRRASVYWTLGQLFAEHGDYEKAKIYFDQAERVMGSLTQKYPLAEERFRNAKKAFELAVKGEESDILKEFEAKGVYK